MNDFSDADKMVLCEVLLDLIDLDKGLKKYLCRNYWKTRLMLTAFRFKESMAYYSNLHACSECKSLRKHYDKDKNDHL